MLSDELGKIERRFLGALFILADDNMTARGNMNTIAHLMGYKNTGGALTLAIKILEMRNYIQVIDKGVYKVLI